MLDRIMPGLGAYNVPTLVRLSVNLDASRLRSAFELVVARHEILRTRLDLVDGTPVQEVFDAGPFDLTVVDLRSLPRSEAQSRAEELLGELAGRGFDLSGDVLLRAALVHLAPDEDLLLVVFHHMGSDHISAGLLFAELDEAQAHTILQPMLAAVPWPKEPPKDPLKAFLFAVREDVPMATRNSPEYAAAAASAGRRAGGSGLVWKPIDPVYRG